MPDITFYSWMIIANVWLAASHCTNDNFGRAVCNIIGVVWLLMAIVGKLVG